MKYPVRVASGSRGATIRISLTQTRGWMGFMKGMEQTSPSYCRCVVRNGLALVPPAVSATGSLQAFSETALPDRLREK